MRILCAIRSALVAGRERAVAYESSAFFVKPFSANPPAMPRVEIISCYKGGGQEPISVTPRSTPALNGGDCREIEHSFRLLPTQSSSLCSRVRDSLYSPLLFKYSMFFPSLRDEPDGYISR